MNTDRLERYAAIRSAIADVLDVRSYEFDDQGGVTVQGKLRVAASDTAAMQAMDQRLNTLGYSGHLQPGPNGHTLFVTRGAKPRYQDVSIKPWVSMLLFVLTFLSVTVTNGLSGASLETLKLDWQRGLLTALAVMLILLAHEMGHFLVARLRGEPASLPIFVPLPLISLAGTLGAMILQSRPFSNRRTLLEVGIAGPIAGFVVALPLFALGLALTNGPITSMPANATVLGESLLTQFLGSAILGAIYTSTTQAIEAHPFVIGAWYGLWITGFNLIPAGQLDGGHIAYALFGAKARYVTYAVMAAMFLLSFVSEVWVVLLVLVFMFLRDHPPVENPHVELGTAHKLLALAGFLLLILTLVPRPLMQL
jgi:Zn-dependent protease